LLSLVAVGQSNSEIARELAISPATVRTHLEKIFKLLNVTNRSAAVAKACPPAPY
jgi:DNA-binding CsgD family transcriptional regulator